MREPVVLRAPVTGGDENGEFAQARRQRGVEADVFAQLLRALGRFGERGIVDLIGVSGYYTLVSMVLNVDRHPLPAGAAAPLPPLVP